MNRQLPLPFVIRPDYARADFFDAPSNAEARTWLDRIADWPAGRLALWGDAGCGKTHLLHRWAARTGAALMDATSLRGVPEPPVRGAAIDDADHVADEEALLHLLNAAAEAGFPVLIAARAPPARWNIRLPDLASRLRAVTAIRILAPEQDLLRALFTRLLADRQLAVPAPVQDYLLRRLPRTGAAMREAAERLDHAALASGRGVTRQLAGDIVAGMETEPFPEMETDISMTPVPSALIAPLVP